jgi:hypothetical protein
MGGQSLSSSQSQQLDEMLRAVAIEIAAQQESGGTTHPLEDGERVHEDALGATYRFELFYEAVTPEGFPVELKVGQERWNAEVLDRRGMSLLLVVERPTEGSLPDRTIRHADLLAEPWFLLEELKKRLRQRIDDGCTSLPASVLLDRMRGEAALGTALAGEPGPSRNREQSSAVLSCASSPLWFVWGPPGTGKTSTLGHLVRKLVEAGETVLVTAHSNVAVDAALRQTYQQLQESTLGKDLLASKQVVRAGPAALEDVKGLQVSSRELALLARPELAAELESIDTELRRLHAGHATGGVRELMKRLRAIRAELGTEERRLYSQAKVLFCTMSKAVISPEIAERTFDAAIVDEVSMAIPPQTIFAGMLGAKRLSVFGDFRQLPPIVQSEHPEVRRLLGDDVFTVSGVAGASRQETAPGLTMLREQYRMHPAIRATVSDFAYHGRLRDGDGVEERTAALSHLQPGAGSPIAWLNMSAHGSRGWSDGQRGSRFNPVSALWSFRSALELAEHTEHTEHVVVLAPYRGQVRLLAALLKDADIDGIELGTVHRFQGAEGAAVVLDLVDAPPLPVPGRPLQGTSGERLLTVGLSRAQGKLVVVSSSALHRPGKRFEKAGAMLKGLGRFECTLDEPWDRVVGGLSLSWTPYLPDDFWKITPSDIVASWLPPNRPKEFKHVSVSHEGRGKDAQALLVTTSETWVASQLKNGTWEAWRIASPRFANALSEAASGSALTTVRSAGGEVGTVVARFDSCPSCGSGCHLEARGTGRVMIVCEQCGVDRWPSLSELTAWASAAGATCPTCTSALVAKRGPRRSFLSCEKYPRCEGSVWVDELVGKAPVPVEDRPRLSVGARTRKQQAQANVGKTSQGHSLASIAAFEDFGHPRAVAERWLELGFDADMAIDLLAAGLDVDEVISRRQSGISAVEIWRHRDGMA